MPGIDNTRELFTYARFLRSWMENKPLMKSLNNPTPSPSHSSASASLIRPSSTSLTRPSSTSLTRPSSTSLTRPSSTSLTRPSSTSLTTPTSTSLTTPTSTSLTTPTSTSLTTTTTTDVKVKLKLENENENKSMEAPTPVDNGGAYLHAWGCPLCHRDPIEPRVANCGHVFCLMCLKDIQVTAELFKYPPRCNLCREDISDRHPIALSSHRTLPSLATANSSPPDGHGLDDWEQLQLPPRGPTVGEALASLEQRAQDPMGRNLYASRMSGAQSAYQYQYQQQYRPHSLQLPHSQPMPRYDGPQGYLPHVPSSDQIVSTIEHSPHGSDSTISETKTSQSEKKPAAVKSIVLKDQGFYLKGELDRDGEARYIIQQNGGRLTANATKSTHYIVMGNGARKTKAMKESFAGTILDEMTFWDLMQKKVGGHTMNVQLQAQQEGEDEHLQNEEAKLRAELTKLEKKTVDVKRKLEQLTETKTGIKKQKREAESLSALANFTREKPES